jgi:hypothetical protein
MLQAELNLSDFRVFSAAFQDELRTGFRLKSCSETTHSMTAISGLTQELLSGSVSKSGKPQRITNAPLRGWLSVVARLAT